MLTTLVKLQDIYIYILHSSVYISNLLASTPASIHRLINFIIQLDFTMKVMPFMTNQYLLKIFFDFKGNLEQPGQLKRSYKPQAYKERLINITTMNK